MQTCLGDDQWTNSNAQDANYRQWVSAVHVEVCTATLDVEMDVASAKRVKVVLLEIGAGNRVPNVRYQSEDHANELSADGADVTLVHVNPLPMGPGDNRQWRLKDSVNNVSVLDTGLNALREIDIRLKRIVGCDSQVEAANAEEGAQTEQESSPTEPQSLTR